VVVNSLCCNQLFIYFYDVKWWYRNSRKDMVLYSGEGNIVVAQFFFFFLSRGRRIFFWMINRML
jgi:hypothetical protein